MKQFFKDVVAYLKANPSLTVTTVICFVGGATIGLLVHFPLNIFLSVVFGFFVGVIGAEYHDKYEANHDDH